MVCSLEARESDDNTRHVTLSEAAFEAAESKGPLWLRRPSSHQPSSERRGVLRLAPLAQNDRNQVTSSFHSRDGCLFERSRIDPDSGTGTTPPTPRQLNHAMSFAMVFAVFAFFAFQLSLVQAPPPHLAPERPPPTPRQLSNAMSVARIAFFAFQTAMLRCLCVLCAFAVLACGGPRGITVDRSSRLVSPRSTDRRTSC